MLTFHESREVLFPDLPGELPRGGELTMPHASDLFAFGVVVVAPVAELLRVIVPRLSGTQRLRDRQHGVILASERNVSREASSVVLRRIDVRTRASLQRGRGHGLRWARSRCP